MECLRNRGHFFFCSCIIVEVSRCVLWYAVVVILLSIQ